MKSIQEMTQAECESAIKALHRKYNLTKTITHYTDEIDCVVNELLYLEDRIDYLKMMGYVAKANEARWSKTNESL